MFITFEGMDGAGKTSTSAAVAEQLIARGYPIDYIDKKSIGLADPHLVRHAESIKALIWSYPASAPIDRLGDAHWLHLMASWFHLLDETVLRPALQGGRVVLVDSWIGKFLARFAIKPGDQESSARHAFEGLSEPTLTVFLDVDPVVAAARKGEFTMAECGNLDGYSGTSLENFVAYQAKNRKALLRFADERSWHRIDTTDRSQNEVVSLATEVICQQISARHAKCHSETS